MMLCLSRKLDERITITIPASSVARVVEIVVVQVRGEKVRLGFQADQDIRIHREEIQALVDRYGEEDKPTSPPIIQRPVRIGEDLPGK